MIDKPALLLWGIVGFLAYLQMGIAGGILFLMISYGFFLFYQYLLNLYDKRKNNHGSN